jgi:hypothetical protein
MVHDTRVIRINGKPKPSNIRQWMGDSVGHYEGDTLVVETNNFYDQQTFMGASPNRKVIERFTRTDSKTMVYQITIDDPGAYNTNW